MRWSDFESLARLASRLLHDNTSATKTAAIRTTSQAPTARPAAGTGQPAADFDGLPEMRYQAKGPGGFASGQIVWTWIAYEEDPSQGKDRPVLLIGAHSGWIIRKHLLTNCMGTLIVTTTLQIPSSIFTESYLSFLGLGVAAPMPSLGSLATDAVKGMNTYPVLLIAPALMISIMILVFNLFGDGLRDAFDPKLKS